MKKMSVLFKKVVSFVMAVTLLTATFSSISTTKVEAADLRSVWTYEDPYSQNDTYGGYKYSTTVHWQYNSKSVNGYRLSVQRVATGSWIVAKTVTNDPFDFSERLFGLIPGYYKIYVEALDKNGNPVQSHYGYYVYIDYSATNYEGTVLK